jgi:methionyl-tRNA synthetase
MNASIADFSKLELRVGTVLKAERVPNSDKLVKMEVSFGAKAESPDVDSASPINTTDIRQILAGIGKAYEPETLVNKQYVFVSNLEPRILMGMESQGMIVAAKDPDGLPILVAPEKSVTDGSRLS